MSGTAPRFYYAVAVLVLLRSVCCLILSALLAACGSSDQTGQGFKQLTGSGGSVPASTSSAEHSSGVGAMSAASGGGAGGADLGPPYPVVLCHGFFGFEQFAGLDFAQYFYELKEHLAMNGEAQVYTPAVDPFNSSSFRGAQLAERVNEILAETGHAKVNLIGHSQGALDIRVVAHNHPDKVASAISLAGPHGGTPIADILLQLVDDPNEQQLIDWLLQTVGAPLYDQIGEQTSLGKPLYDFSQPGVAVFNASYPDQPGVYYASIAGRSDWHLGGSACSVNGPSFISDYKYELDPIDPLFDVAEMILDGGIGNPFPNDGLVRVKDAKWGEFLGCLPADHLDLIGHLFGDGPGLGNDWNYRQFYEDLLGFLRSKGL